MGDIDSHSTDNSNGELARGVAGLVRLDNIMRRLSMSQSHLDNDQHTNSSWYSQVADPFGGMSPGASTFQPHAYGSIDAVVSQPTIVSSVRSGMGMGMATDKGKQRATFGTSYTTDRQRADQTRHFVKIGGVSSANLEHLKLQFQDKTIHEKVDGSCYYICFDDIRDAAKAAEQAVAIDGGTNITYVSDSFFVERVGLSSLAHREAHIAAHTGCSQFDGQVVFYVVPTSTCTLTAAQQDTIIPQRVAHLADSFGEVLAMNRVQDDDPWAYRVEYFKFSGAQTAVEDLSDGTPHHVDGCSITAKSFTVHLAAQYEAEQRYDPSKFGAEHYQDSTATTPTQEAATTGAQTFFSPSGRSAWTYDAEGRLVTKKAPKTIPKVATGGSDLPPTPSRSRPWQSLPMPETPAMIEGNGAVQRHASYTPGDQSAIARMTEAIQAEPKDTQDVHIARIANGQDVRTTVMIRNLPNDWTCVDVKAALDKVSFGQYDFAYLRIDFARNLNVGYGFVNFVNAEAIIPFAQAYQRRDWAPGIFPRRLGQISYATVQGYDCLIEKFRNSAIMDECPDYRPKIFHSFESAPSPELVGTEKVFPVSNNASKKQRSQDNAGQVGLYAPRSGGRDNRARRSNWDRGTTRQIQDDAAYYAHTAGPAYAPAQAPIGTAMGVPYPQPSGFPQMVPQQYYGGMPHVDGMGYAMAPYQAPYQQAPYQAPYQHAPYAGMPYAYPPANAAYGPYPGPSQTPGGYNTVNRASSLRTLTGGRLATRPRTNVTTADPSRYDPAPGVPRSIVASGNGEFVSSEVAQAQYSAAGNAQYGQQYYTANGTYDQAPGSGIQFHYPQY